MKWRRFFSFLAAKQGKDGVEVLEQKLDLEQLQVRLSSNCGQTHRSTDTKACLILQKDCKAAVTNLTYSKQLEAVSQYVLHSF